MREFREKSVSRPVRYALTAGWVLFFLAGITVAVLGSIPLGVLLFAIGAILFAVRGYLRTGDRAVSGVLIFVALTAIGTQAIVFFLAP